MAFSDAFLRGYTAGKAKEDDNRQILTALLNRRSSSGSRGSALYPSRVADNDPLARVNQASKEYEAEQLRDEALKQAEAEAETNREQQNLKTELMRRELAAKPTALDSALAKAQTAAGTAHAGALARDLEQPQLQQSRMAEEANQINQYRQMMYQGYVNRDMEALTQGFNGAFPVQSIERDKLRGRDEDTGKEMDYMKYSNRQAQFRTGENGNVYIKYPGNDEWVPFNDAHMRQFMIASNPKLMQSGKPAPAKKASSTTTADTTGSDEVGGPEEAEVDLSKMSEKDKGKYLLDKSKDRRDTMKARTEYAKTLATNVAGEVDEDKWAKAWAESGKILGSEKAQKQLGFPTPQGYNVPVSEAAGTQAAIEYAKKLDGIKETRGPAAAVEDSKMIQGLLLAKFGAPGMLAFQDELMKSGPEWFTGVKIPANYKMGKYDADGNLRPKAGVTITPGVPEGVTAPKGGETATIGDTTISAGPKGPPMKYDFDKEQWRPMTAQESGKLLNNLEKAYNADEGFKEDLAKVKKILTALNTYGTGRKKGEPTLFQQYIQSQAEAMKGPGRAGVDMHGNKIPWQKKPEKKGKTEKKTANDEAGFQKWYADWAKKLNLNPDPDNPKHFYDYRAAYRAGAKPDASGHWPSKYKKPGHPREVIDGVNTRTGEKVKPTAKVESGVAYAAEPPKPKSALQNEAMTKDKLWAEYQKALKANTGGKGGHIEGAPAGVKISKKETKESLWRKYQAALENQEAVRKAVEK